MFRDSCISELPTQATFEVATRTIIQVPELNSEDLDDGDEVDSDEPPMKRAYTETTANGSSGISKLVEFCSKDIKYVCFVYNVVDRSLLVVARFVWWSVRIISY